MTKLVTCLLLLGLCQTESSTDTAEESEAKAERRIPAEKALGKLSGRFVFDGEPPPRKALEISTVRSTLTGEKFTDSDAVRFSQLNLSDESLLVGPDRGIQNILVWVSDPSIPIPAVPPARRNAEPAKLAFRAGRLQPHVLAWWADERMLQLGNEDSAPFNLQWDSAKNGAINQLVPGNDQRLHKVVAERHPSSIKSSIYPWLQAAILFPCAHPYFAVTDAEGYFTISDLPPGKWEFRAWHERCGWVKSSERVGGRFTVEIKPGRTDYGTIVVSPGLLEKKPQTLAALPVKPPTATPNAERPGWKALEEQRRAMHEANGAVSCVGNWRLHLPAGFHYDVELKKTEDGLLKLQARNSLTLLGTFAFSKNQLMLVKPVDDGIDDFVWHLNEEGMLILITDRNRVGARYLGAVMERAN